MAAQTNASLPEGLEVGGYRIVKKISSGGFSIVYLATDENGNSVAIKEYMPAALAQRKTGELSPYVAPENLNTYRIGLKCFFEEGRALASIYHPNIVRVDQFLPRERDRVHGDELRIRALACRSTSCATATRTRRTCCRSASSGACLPR